MPLPPALAARLAKRGIIQLPKQAEPEPVTPAEEEIIAEDYDDTPQQETPSHLGADTFDPFQGYSGCPNKWNVYHECTPSCRDLWRECKPLETSYDKRRLKMLAKYPLPDHWQEILDPGIGRYYYWNTETDLVSWLPPGHPKCQVSRAAANLRKQMITDRNKRLQEEKEMNIDTDSKKRPISDDEDMSDQDSEDSDSDDERPPPPDPRDKRGMDKSKLQMMRDRDRRGRRTAKDELDPMDPASYGDCPRGTWSSGLPQQNDAITGADTTASGPLYQKRPYPNPGAVLRANASGGGSSGPKKPN